MMWGITAYWVNEVDIASPVFLELDEFWWQCVSHWGPVLRTGILVAE